MTLRNQYKAFERAYAAGVKIAFGTDAGTFTHGDNAKEFELMVKYGMPPMDAIRCCNRRHRRSVRLSARTPARSRRASSLTSSPCKGNPLDNISALREIDFIMKSGRIAKQDGHMTEPFTYARRPAF